MKPTELLKLSDVALLQALVKRYPETIYLAGKAEASPEGNPLLKNNALAYQVFDSNVEIDPTAVEADRTFLGLLTLKWVLTGEYHQFTSLQTNSDARLSRASFDKLAAYTQRIAGTEADLEFCLYSLACNDLGKTLFLVEKHKQVTGQTAEDHDQLLGRLIQEAPELFPAFQGLLTEAQQQSYIRGITANLNLGQFVQGENLPVNLMEMQAIDAKSRELRLVCELFDFAGVMGHVNAGGSMVMTEDNYQAFSAAIEELTKEPLGQSYHRYIAQRSRLVGLQADTPEGIAMGRIAALSRAFKPEQGQAIQTAWATLSDEERQTLTAELTETGLDGHKGILVYYAPAVIANAVKAAGSYAAGLDYALPVLAKVYRDARAAKPNQNGNGIITANVAELARQAAQQKPAAVTLTNKP
jgi:hypothetical protein